MKDPIENFVYFLENTLMPDMIESGTLMNNVKDFKIMIKFLRGADRAHGYNVEKFIKYLEETVVPDLRKEGYECTPDDFALGAKLIYWMNNE